MLNRTTTLAVLALGVLLSASSAEASFILATPVTPPGWNPDYNGPVLLFGFSGTGPLDPLSTIPGRPETLLDDPGGAAFDAHGELFVGNRSGLVGGGVGSIARFLIDASGNYVPNGAIDGNGLEGVNGLAFSSTGELFAANYRANTISRFVFDENGTAIPNGVIAVTGSDYLIGVAFSPSGELFANDIGKINRFLFDDTGAAIPNGSFTVPLDNPGYIAFSPDGEMFVASHDNDTVFRFLFDADGNPYGNGTISVHGPLGFAFTPTGEMIVTSHGFLSTIYDPDFGQISRFLFDSEGNAIPNGILTTPSLGQPAIYEWSVPEPGTFALFSLALAGLGVASRVRAIQSTRASRCRVPGRRPVWRPDP